MRIATSYLQGIWSNSFLQVSKTRVLGHFVLIYACFVYQCFFSGTFSSKGFFVQLSTSSLKQVFLLDPPPLPLLRICPNSSHITSVLTIVTAAISCQRELHGSLQCHVHIHACQLYCDLCQLVWLKIQSLQGKTASACHRMSSAWG